MNRERRKVIERLVARLADVEAEIEDVVAQEADYLNNMPESFQDSQKGSDTEERISSLEQAQNSVPEVINYLEEACN